MHLSPTHIHKSFPKSFEPEVLEFIVLKMISKDQELPFFPASVSSSESREPIYPGGS
jgi:hypothetical protein